jgi:hypothetical protein
MLGMDALITNIITYLVDATVSSTIWLYNGVSTEKPPRTAAKTVFDIMG